MKKRLFLTSLLLSVTMLFSVSCGNVEKDKVEYENYDGRVFYEIFVRAFADSDGDGIGDLQGVISKLDYLEDLGVQGIWLMPIQESTSYHGYDVEDYYAIEKDYGTMDDLKELIAEADKRDIKIVMDLVMNHTSREHPWFKEAMEDTESPYRDYYIWTDDMSLEKKYSPMGTIGWAKNPLREELYYAIFWEGMPDLNFENEQVIKEMEEIAEYYLDMGIDGFRLDAAKWIFDEEEGNTELWTNFNSYVKDINSDAVLIGEVWDKAFNCIPYAGPLDSFFDFETGEKIIDALNSGRLTDIAGRYLDISEQYKENSEDFTLAPFLTNHDQNRIMSMLNEDQEKMRIAAAMYLTLPGTPYIYYGEELGMTGIKPDEKIREPFLWGDTDSESTTNWIEITNNPEIALDKQIEDSDSLYNFYKDVLAIRKQSNALVNGEAEAIESPASVFALKRYTDKETIVVVANGGEAEEVVTIEEGKYKVLLDSQDKEQVGQELKVEETLEIKAGQVIILEKQ